MKILQVATYSILMSISRSCNIDYDVTYLKELENGRLLDDPPIPS